MLHAPARRDRRAARSALRSTLGTLGTYLDRQGFNRTGLLVLFDETEVTIAGLVAYRSEGQASRKEERPPGGCANDADLQRA